MDSQSGLEVSATIIKITILVAAVVLLSVFNYILPTGTDWQKPRVACPGVMLP